MRWVVKLSTMQDMVQFFALPQGGSVAEETDTCIYISIHAGATVEFESQQKKMRFTKMTSLIHSTGATKLQRLDSTHLFVIDSFLMVINLK